jgi:hypothetical protein
MKMQHTSYELTILLCERYDGITARESKASTASLCCVLQQLYLNFEFNRGKWKRLTHFMLLPGVS